ncbi:MAG: alpha protein [Candidatus Hydrogenedentes bacterium]|nr:alpha protein [Candidatus Hydrogenedentota bacterium]
MFSWRRTAGEGYHLWTVGVDGSALTQLTEGPWHDYNGCWLPDGGIAFLSTRKAQFAYCWHAPVGVVHRMEADGSGVRLLSANYLNDFTPYVLDDGRIIYSRWEYVDRPAIPIQSLWTVNPDGTGLSGYFGNRVISPGTFMESRSIPGTTRIVCTMTGHNGPTRGAIGIIDRSRGVNDQAAIESITPDVPLPRVDEGNGNTGGSKLYSCPLPLDGARFLVSARGPVLVRTFAGDCQSVAIPEPSGGMQYFNAQPVRPRPRPPVIHTALPEPAPEEPFAVLFLQDVYRGLEPHVKRGEVKRLRVVREMEKTVRIDPSLRAFGFQFPVISCGATYAGKDVLGEVPVREDGSASFRVPSGVPIYFIALDAEGRAVQRMRSFTHLMPGEVQGCIGCHEPRGQSSPPKRGAAFAEAPVDLETPEWGSGGFGYAAIVQPVLDQYCIRCHSGVDAPRGIDLTGDKTDFFNVSYELLARENQGPKGSPYVNWIPTYNGQEQNILEVTPKVWGSHQSKLADIVLSGHPDADGKSRFEMDEAGRRRILAWIDLNVPYYASSETAYPEREGCRRILPPDLEAVLTDVAQRRCAGCHAEGKIPCREWTRITGPERNDFLTAPLARPAGGSGKCGQAVFADMQDPDYQAILATFRPIAAMLAENPRMDMPGARPAPAVCRDRK